MLSIEEGKDYEDVNEAELPYTLLRNLGHGHSGNVEAIRDEMTKRVFARKTIHIPPSRLGKQERLKTFRNEVAIIRELARHRHVVSVFATYVTKRHFGLILQPVASNGDLEDFLGEYWSLVEEKEGGGIDSPRLETMALVMQRAFGCLALGPAFIHEKKIRHKDIRPRNILIHEGLVLYTDFGYSIDSNAFSRSTTEERPAFLTRKYSAPEVLEQEKRNSKSDVFSLGCVFIDLLYALTMIPEADLHVKCYAESIDDIHKLFESTQISSDYSQIWTIIKEMTLQKDSMRLHATQVVDKILVMPNFSCGDCLSGSMKAPRSKDLREVNMGEGESAKREQDLLEKKPRIKDNSAKTDRHFSDTSDTLGVHHRESARILTPKDDKKVKAQYLIVGTIGTEKMTTVLDMAQPPVDLFPDPIPKSEARELEGETVSNDNSQLSKQTKTLSIDEKPGEEERGDNGTMVEGEATTREDQEGTQHDINSLKTSSASTYDQTKHITISISSLESLDWTWSADEQKFYRLAHDEQGKPYNLRGKVTLLIIGSGRLRGYYLRITMLGATLGTIRLILTRIII